MQRNLIGAEMLSSWTHESWISVVYMHYRNALEVAVSARWLSAPAFKHVCHIVPLHMQTVIFALAWVFAAAYVLLLFNPFKAVLNYETRQVRASLLSGLVDHETLPAMRR
eukprot:533772-Pelagomonas_calceolata.AAC.15